MKFEWDENKRRSNILKHGIDFIDSANLFRNPVLIMEDTRRDYREKRFIAVGIIDGRPIVLSLTEREGKFRVISMRKANQREQKKYKEAITAKLEKS